MLRWIYFVLLALVLQASGQTPPPEQAAATPSPTPPNGKHVVVDKTKQMLRAYDGDKLVFETRISTGKWDKSTPNGQYTAGDKERMHYSKLFKNAPMPFSVQVHGDVFIHGFSSVPKHPASHGCIRVPLDGGNPAKRFFDWVEPGTPIEVMGQWEGW